MIEADRVHSTPPTSTSAIAAAAPGLAETGAAAPCAQLEALLTPYVDALIQYRALSRAARAEVDAHFDPDMSADCWQKPELKRSPAFRAYKEAGRKQGVDAAAVRLRGLHEGIEEIAEAIAEAGTVSLADMRAKALVSLWEAIQGSGDDEGALEFEDHRGRMLFDACAALTGLLPLVEAIEAKLTAARPRM